MLTFAFVTGTEPDKWLRRFHDRTSYGRINALATDDPMAIFESSPGPGPRLALVRLPQAHIDERFHKVELYTEQLGIALPKDHTLTLLDSICPEDLTGEIHTAAIDRCGVVDMAGIRGHLQVVAAGVGAIIAPRPLLKTLSGKQIEHRAYRDDTYPPIRIALVWLKEEDCDAIQDFVGIAKGRTPQSSRQVATKRSAKEKAVAKKQRRAASAPQQPRGRGGRKRR